MSHCHSNNEKFRTVTPTIAFNKLEYVHIRYTKTTFEDLNRFVEILTVIHF